MIGRIISHYRVLEKLGAGGMGQVYKAEDTKLGRLVALKFLSPDLARDPAALQRLEREARAASALNHPNICTIYEIDDAGPPFIAMELLDGKTLRQRLADRPCAVEQVLALGLQMVDALEAAHAKGIVHGDLKPENVFVSDRDHVKLLDFGLAKVHRVAEPDAVTQAPPFSDPTVFATQPGIVLGTVEYMSPEQARGEKLDARSDLFSLGVVLYEMAAGARPFSGPTAALTFDAILNRDPRPPAQFTPGLPGGLEQVLLKLLEKDPALRYQRAAELKADLTILHRDATAIPVEATRPVRRQAPSTSRLRRRIIVAALVAAGLVGTSLVVLRYVAGPQTSASIAVLPFANASGDPNAQYLIDGVAEGVMNTLSRLPALRVLPRATAFRYRSDTRDLPQIGQELGVRTLLTGRVSGNGDMLSVQVELTNSGTNAQLWGAKFNRDASDLVDLEEEIATAVAEHLPVRLTGEDRQKLAKRATSDPEAYRVYLKGHSLWDEWTEVSLQASLAFFRQATQKDPTYALAYFGLANSYVALSFLNMAPKTSMPLAKANVTKALDLDESLPEAHYLLGIVHLYYDWDMDAAERQFKRSLALNPRSAEAHFGYSNYLVAAGRLNEALTHAERAVELDPLSNTWNEQLAVLYSGLGQLDRAEVQARKTLKLDPTSFWLKFDLGMIATRRGQPEAALREFEESVARASDNPYAIGYLGFGQARAGRQADARKTLARLDDLARTRYVSSFPRALVYAGLGDTNRTFALLDQAREERDCWLPWYFILDGAFDDLKSDRRYTELLKPLRAGTH